MKKVLIYGTVDLLHYVHINILKRAKEMGDYLIIGISSDEFNDMKGKFDYLSQYCKVKYLPRTEGISTTQIK